MLHLHDHPSLFSIQDNHKERHTFAREKDHDEKFCRYVVNTINQIVGVGVHTRYDFTAKQTKVDGVGDEYSSSFKAMIVVEIYGYRYDCSDCHWSLSSW